MEPENETHETIEPTVYTRETEIRSKGKTRADLPDATVKLKLTDDLTDEQKMSCVLKQLLIVWARKVRTDDGRQLRTDYDGQTIEMPMSELVERAKPSKRELSMYRQKFNVVRNEELTGAPPGALRSLCDLIHVDFDEYVSWMDAQTM